MKDYVIVTDSTCDLPAGLIDQLQLKVLPMSFEIEGKSYRNYPDAREYPVHDFYDKLRQGKQSKTAQITPAEFIDAFEEILTTGKDIFYLAFSSGLSGTYNASEIAAQELMERHPECNIVCVDSRAASVGEGMLAYYTMQKQREGLSLQELKEWFENAKGHLCHWFTVDDLNHLKRGGRVSAVAAVMGTALGIKPILHVDDEGHLIPMGKVRGRKRSIESLFQHMKDTAIHPEAQVIFIGHGDSLEDAQKLEQMIRAEWKVQDVIINPIGPVIGSHSGPGTIALFFFGTHK